MNKTLSEKYKLFTSFTVGSHTYYFNPTWGKSIQFKDGSVIIESHGGTVSYKVDTLSEKVEKLLAIYRFDGGISESVYWQVVASVKELLDTHNKQLYQELEKMKPERFKWDYKEGEGEFKDGQEDIISKAQELLGGTHD